MPSSIDSFFCFRTSILSGWSETAAGLLTPLLIVDREFIDDMLPLCVFRSGTDEFSLMESAAVPVPLSPHSASAKQIQMSLASIIKERNHNSFRNKLPHIERSYTADKWLLRCCSYTRASYAYGLPTFTETFHHHHSVCKKALLFDIAGELFWISSLIQIFKLYSQLQNETEVGLLNDPRNETRTNHIVFSARHQFNIRGLAWSIAVQSSSKSRLWILLKELFLQILYKEPFDK